MTRQREIAREEEYEARKALGLICGECGLYRLHRKNGKEAHYCPKTGRCSFTGNEPDCEDPDCEFNRG